MKHTGLFVLAAAAIAVGAAVPAAPAGAQEPLPLDVTPTSGWVGRRVSVSGQGCLNDTGKGLVTVLLFGEDEQRQFTVEDVLDDGSWSTIITLPEGLVPGPHVLTAACAFAGGGEVDYAVVDFEVIDRTVLDVTPTSGSVGSRVTVSGQGCVNDTGTGTGLVSVLLFGQGDQRQFTVDDVLDDGSWSTIITLPEGLVPGPHLLTAVCAFPGGGELDYTPVDFEVIDRTVLDVTPTSGSVGSRVRVSGQGCVNDTGTGTGLVSVLLFGQGDQRQFTVDDVLDDGSWSTIITLPEGLAAGPHLLTAVCAFPEGGELDYTPVDFEVIDATATPPTTTTTVVTPTPEPAPPATPVPGEPAFTG